MRKRALALLVLAASCAAEVSGPATPSRPTLPVPPSVDQPRTAGEKRALFRAGVEAFERADWASSEERFRLLESTYPELGDYVLAYLARLAGRRGDAAAALPRWQALVDRYPDSIWRGEAALAIGDQLRAGTGEASAEPWYRDATDERFARETRAGALGRLMAIARNRGDGARAHAIGEDLRKRFAGTPEARRASEDAWDEREAWALTGAGATLEEIGRLVGEGRADRAVDLAREAEARRPGDPRQPDLALAESNALARAGKKDEAAEVLESIRRRFPASDAARTALFRQASAAWNRDDDDRALELFAAFLRVAPRAESAPDALYAMGRIHQERREFDAAAAAFKRLADGFGGSSLASEADWRVGWCRYLAGEWLEAARELDRVGRHASNEKASAIYWSGRALERARRDPSGAYRNLLAKLPESYYATLAEARLGLPRGSSLAARAIPPSANVPVPTGDGTNLHWVRFEELRQASLRDLARGELRAYARDSPSAANDEQLLPAWSAVDAHAEAIRLVVKLGGCNVDRRLASYCYPLGFRDRVELESGERGIDPLLVASLIRQESLYDDHARSPADARGLMQLMPATAKRVARSLGDPEPEAGDLYHASLNVRLGTTYLSGLLKDYSGSIVRSLAAYNAGEAAVAKWDKRYPGVDEEEFVERITYRETRSYVKRVLANRRVYGVLYGEPSGRK